MAFHVSKGTFFNHCKIQVNNHPKNTLKKIYHVFMVLFWEFFWKICNVFNVLKLENQRKEKKIKPCYFISANKIFQKYSVISFIKCF
jgi:hypothetical protein